MYGTGDRKKPRKRQDWKEANVDFDGEIDTSARNTLNSNISNHSQQAPLLANQQSHEEHEWEGGYGSIPGAMQSSTVHSYRSMQFMNAQTPQSFFPPNIPGTPPPMYGQAFARQSKTMSQSAPPRPSQYPIESSTSRNRNTSISPRQSRPPVFEATVNYSDDEDRPFYPSPRTSPMNEVSGKTGNVSRENEDNQMNRHDRQQPRKKRSVRRVPSLSELNDDTGVARPGNQHRRNYSDFLYQKRADASVPNPAHRRISSAELQRKEYIEPLSNNRSPLPLHPFQRKSAPPPARVRSSSYGGSRHKRGDSTSSMASFASILSDRSIVSDISKSALFKDVTGTGVVQFHAPIDNIRLVMNKDLVAGELYKVKVGEDEEDRCVSYTMQSDENFSDLLLNDSGCDCECVACAKCHNKIEQMLYPARYVLQVNDNLYQRVIGEISDSKQPCGLFFCGHHEDVEKPSIFIAVGIVGAIFGMMLLLTFF